MYFYFITILAILIPLLAQNKVLGLRISLFLLFILLGFQYELVQDWTPNIGRWKYANLNASIWDAGTGGRDIEPFFMYLLKLFKPITFFGWLILTTALFLLLLYYLMRWYVPAQYYWVTIFLFMLRTDYGLLFINSNRQCWSLMFAILSALVLLEKIKIPVRIPFVRKSYTKYVISIVLVYVGAQCHSSAYIAFLIIPIYLWSHVYNGKWWLMLAIICNIFYIGKIFIDISALQVYMTMFSDEMMLNNVEGYIEQIGTEFNNNSFFEISCYNMIITAVCYYYHQMPQPLKFFSIMWYVGLLLSSYLPSNVARMGEFMYYYLLLVLPFVVMSLRTERTKTMVRIRSLAFSILIFYCVWSSWNNMHHYLYERWMDYISVFEAPRWI